MFCNNNFSNYKQTPVLIIEKAKAIKDGFRHLMKTFYKLEKDHLLNTLTIPLYTVYLGARSSAYLQQYI